MNLAIDSSAKANFKDVYSEEGMDLKEFAKELGIDETVAKKADKDGKGTITSDEMKEVFMGKIEGIKVSDEDKKDIFNSVIQTATEDKPAMEREELDEIVEEKLGMTRAKECNPTEKKCGTEKEDPVRCDG